MLYAVFVAGQTDSPLSILARALDTTSRKEEASAAMRPLRAALRELDKAGVTINALKPRFDSLAYAMVATAPASPKSLFPSHASFLDCTVYTSSGYYRHLSIQPSSFTDHNARKSLYACSSLESRHPRGSAKSDVNGLGETEFTYIDSPEAAVEWLMVKLAPAVLKAPSLAAMAID
jgi:hypothetical protein